MSNKARQYRRSHVRRLDTLSSNQCSKPECKKPLIAEDGISIVSKICHIEAASPEGPRWNPDMTDDERRHYDNLILLCDEHHVMIDNKENEETYSVILLKSWKKQHEGKMIYKLRNLSSLKQAVYAIADIESLQDIVSGDEDIGFDISGKIDHNSLKRNRYTIEEYKVFYSKISRIYFELETAGSFKKEKLLRNIKNIYLRSKGKYLTGNLPVEDEIKLKSDDIFEDVEDQLFSLLEGSDSSNDDFGYAVSVIMVDAFMRCKILERPKHLTI